MPSKLQVKMLSQSGELLNVINCPAGRVSVFRGSTPADLRPYQRALIGTHGKEKMSVVVDGNEFSPDQHNVIGLGEVPPHVGLTVRDFLEKVNVKDEAISSLLNSYGLENTTDLKCSSLSPDQERRLRILYAISQPERVLIVNEPFELITSQWKERFAELLLDFARLKNGVVVIPSLSYRPECWIDNTLISRIEVGQSIQRTIGFGQAGSDANQMIEELRQKLKEDQAGGDDQRRRAAIMSAAAASVVPTIPTDVEPASDMSLIKSWLFSRESLAFKVVSSLLAAAIGVGGALTTLNFLSDKPSEEKPSVVAAVQPPVQAVPVREDPKTQLETAIDKAKEVAQQPSSLAPKQEAVTASVRYILDEYPEVIRLSIIETSHNNPGEVAPVEPQTEVQKGAASKAGNLYSLLERAGSESGSPSGGGSAPAAVQEEAYSAPESEGDSPVEATEEDQKREEIRAKFLEAIRSAAERREASMDEE